MFLSFVFSMLINALLRRANLVTYFVERLKFLQGEFNAENNVHSTVTLLSVHPQDIDRMTESFCDK